MEYGILSITLTGNLLLHLTAAIARLQLLTLLLGIVFVTTKAIASSQEDALWHPLMKFVCRVTSTDRSKPLARVFDDINALHSSHYFK